jgi:cell wall-associated NlpC family hydrolase
VLLWLAFVLPALQGLRASDTDAAAASDVSPSPSPAQTRKHAHPRRSPTIAHDDSDREGQSDPDATPAAKKKHRHPVETDEPGAASPAATPKPSTEESDATPEPSGTPRPRPSVAPDASLDSDQLQDFSEQPAKVRALIEACLDLTRQNLTYTFSSADPANGGMDCSGFIYYVLTQAGLRDVPRDASDQYSWVRKAGKFRAVISRSLDGFEMDEIKPGDLLFWSGTYQTAHDPPVTHTMIYLGREKETGDRVMAGSSDGRSYHGLERWGVSVFDFKPSAATPAPGRAGSQFIGYAAIPGL